MADHPLDQIVPTELDTFFRRKQIHGFVHDEGASMMNMKSSNAGLFANATDIAKLMQMYVDMGQFGGQQYLQESTLKEFTRCQYCDLDNRRGLGFDKPLKGENGNSYPAKSASPSSFGHSGFTGNFVWADPEYGLVYVFLSNRVYPTRSNTKLYEMNIRTDIQQVVYDALGH
jgi:CubicO group peptidase (beta-lactamase class C family)